MTKKPALYLSLKKKWYDMICCGIKREEYRNMTNYWNKRLFYTNGEPKDFEYVEFTLGYPAKSDNSRRMRFKITSISKRCGKEEWGAEKGVCYYVIQLGDII